MRRGSITPQAGSPPEGGRIQCGIGNGNSKGGSHGGSKKAGGGGAATEKERPINGNTGDGTTKENAAAVVAAAEAAGQSLSTPSKNLAPNGASMDPRDIAYRELFQVLTGKRTPKEVYIAENARQWGRDFKKSEVYLIEWGNPKKPHPNKVFDKNGNPKKGKN